ncbi:MAG: hypothetical protein K5981_06745, partial [Clostridia bacterium]|nr:hypothetical protein [Clostridia bacterium]
MRHFKDEAQLKRVFRLFVACVFCYGIVEGFSLNIFSNFFKDAYNVSDQVRGWIETPRESPGVFCMFYLPALAAFADVRLARYAVLVDAAALLLMGFLPTPFWTMMVFLLLFSFGSHTYYPMEGSIGLAIAGESPDMGQTLGRIRAVAQVAYFVAATAVLVFFRSGFFDFTASIRRPFLFGAIACVASFILLGLIEKDLSWMPRREKGKLVVKKEFANYYLLTFAFGIQKRIRMVFALWMFTQLLSKKADFTAILLIASAIVGIFVSPQMGKLLDRMGQRRAVMFEGVYMLVVFTVYGFVAKGFADGTLLLTNAVLYFSIGLFVAADLTKFFEFFHNFAMRKMAKDEKDVSPTLSVGQAIDHVMAISLSPAFGAMWAHFGPQSVFWTCAAVSIVQFFVAP